MKGELTFLFWTIFIGFALNLMVLCSAESCTANGDCTTTTCAEGNTVICQHPAGAGIVTDGGLCTCATTQCNSQSDCFGNATSLTCSDNQRHCYDNNCICDRFPVVRDKNSASTADPTEQEKTTVVDSNRKHICQHTDDIAIIGAGIAGSYAAWRLRRANMTVTLYEYSNRIGGRCHTIKFPGIPDINVELGAMRFHPEDHKMLNKTITDLGLEIIDFLPENNETLYHLRGELLSTEQLINNPPYNLKPQHKKQPGQLQWEIFNNYTDVNTSVNGYADPPHVWRYHTPDGVPLYQQSFKSFYGKYLYPELASFMEDISGFSESFQGASASAVIPISDPALTPPHTTKTVREGFQAIPETMVKQFLEANSRHTLKRNHHLKTIRKLDSGHYEMVFQPTETIRRVTKDKVEDRIHVCAKTILLAIPRLALEHLDWEPLKDPVTDDYIKNSLHEAKAGKMYFAYDDPWWLNVVNFAPIVYSNTPLRVTYNFGVSNLTKKAVLNPVYNDLYTKIWRNTLRQGKYVPGIGDDSIRNTDVNQNMARKFLAQIYEISLTDVPEPKYSVMRIWDDYPIGASWYRFRPGYLWYDVADHMMKPSNDDEVYVISNTFSRVQKQPWTDGALEIVDSMLKKYLPQFYNL